MEMFAKFDIEAGEFPRFKDAHDGQEWLEFKGASCKVWGCPSGFCAIRKISKTTFQVCFVDGVEMGRYFDGGVVEIGEEEYSFSNLEEFQNRASFVAHLPFGSLSATELLDAFIEAVACNDESATFDAYIMLRIRFSVPAVGEFWRMAKETDGRQVLKTWLLAAALQQLREAREAARCNRPNAAILQEQAAYWLVKFQGTVSENTDKEIQNIVKRVSQFVFNYVWVHNRTLYIQDGEDLLSWTL